MMLLMVCLILSGYLCYLWQRYPALFPPHPSFSIPIIGDLWYFKEDFASGLRKIKARHGDIFGFLLGSQRVVVLCNHDLIQEVSKRPDISGRMVRPARAKAKGSEDPWDSKKMPGVGQSQGQVWQEQRRFLMRTLKDVAFRDENIEKIMTHAIHDACTNLRTTGGQPTDIKIQFRTVFVKVFWKLLAGEILYSDNPQLVKMLFLASNDLLTKSTTLYRFVSTFPTIAYWAQQLCLWDCEKTVEEVVSHVATSISTLPNRSSNHSGNTFIDRFTRKIEEQNVLLMEASFVGKFGHTNLVNVAHEVLVAANHAPDITLKWAMLFMILYPNIQEKVHRELDTNIGKGVQPCALDSKKTPYVEAVLLEVHRLGRVTDLSLPHRTMKDCYLSTGHYLPKDTMVKTWLGEAMRDPKYFTKPNTFDPNRFLNKEGAFVPHPQVIPFGLGKRRCSGENIAKKLIYLVFTGIMTNFKLEKVHEFDETIQKRAPDSLPPFQLKFVPR